MATIRKSKSGSYEAIIRLKGLKPISKSFKTKTLATKFVRQVEGDSQLQRALGKPVIHKITFKKFAQQYIDNYEGKDSSVIGRIEYWIYQFGDKDMSEVTPLMIDECLIKLSKTSNPKKSDSGKPSKPVKHRTGSTVNRYKSNLSSVFLSFIRHPEYKYLGIPNPVQAELISHFKENPAKDRYLTTDEQTKLLTACRDSSYDKLYLLVKLALTTGARKGELLGLNWSDIDFNLRLAALYDTKNKKPRMLPLTKSVINELEKHKQDIGMIFPNTNPFSNNPFEIKKPYAKALADAGISNFRFHDLRQYACSKWCYTVRNSRCAGS